MGSSVPDPTVLPTAYRRTCMVCGSRPGGLVDPDCVLCEGAGQLALGPMARTEGPEAAGMKVYDVLAPFLWPKFHRQTPFDDAEIAYLCEDLIEGGWVRRLPETLYARPLATSPPTTTTTTPGGDDLAAARARRTEAQ